MAQSIAGTALATNAAAVHRTICVELRIAWGETAWPSNWTTGATDETSRLLSASWSRQLDASPLSFGRSPVAEMTIELDNRDGRFSPFLTSSPITADILDTATTAGGTSVSYPKLWGTPVRLRMGFVDSVAGNEFITVFSGYIDQPSDSYGTSGGTFSVRCLDRGAVLLQKKSSTTVYNNQRTDQWIGRLVDSIGGISGGSYDTGFFYLPYAWLDDEAVYSEAQAAAASEGGYFFFDETGIPQFRNAAWWVTDSDSTSSQWTFSTGRFTNITATYDWATVGTGAIAEYEPRFPGGLQVVYRSDEGIVVPPEGYTLEARFTYPCLAVKTPDKTNGVDYRPVSAGGTDLSESVTAVLSEINAQRCTVTFTNDSDVTAFVPSFQIRGSVITGSPSQEVERNVATPLVPEKVQRLPGNPYGQTRGQADLLALLSADRLRYPRLTYSVNARAVPWLQLGDMVTVSASDILSSNRTAIVTGLNYAWSPQSTFDMTVTCIDSGGLFEYASYFVIGTSKYGPSGSPDTAPVFL